MRPLRADALVLLGLLLLFGLLTYVIAGRIPEAPETTPRRTTYSAKPGGLKAAYLLLEQRNLPVDRNFREPARWPQDARVMITATPYESVGVGVVHFWSEDEIKAATRWIDRGGTLIVLHNQSEALLSKLGLTVSQHLATDATLSPGQPLPFLRGVRGVYFPGKERFMSLPASGVALFGDRKPAMVALSRGKGRVYALSTPAVFENQSLTKADNARFLVQFVAATAGTGSGRIYFNEFHQGFDRSIDEDSLWALIGKPGQFAFLQLVLVALLAAYSAARRFGRPRPVPTPPRVSSEYVLSLADLYRRARASDAALEGVYLSFWRDLCRAAGVSLEAEIPEVARRAAALADGDRERRERRLLQLLQECESKYTTGPKAITDADLLRLTRDMEAMRKELQLGGDEPIAR